MRRSIPSMPSMQSSKSLCMRASQFPYICASCRHQALRQRISQPQSTRNASSGLPWTERLRRKMWGTDNPPGMKDPYGGPGYFEQRRQEAHAEREEERRGSVQAPAPAEPAVVKPEPAPFEREISRHDLASPEPTVLEHEAAADARLQYAEDMIPSRSVTQNDPVKEDSNYVPAETWDGLEQVGLSGHWSEKPPTPEESFRPFLATFERASTREEILSSLHQAVVEVITLRDSIFPLHRDLGHVTYPPAVLASISSTTIDYDSTGRQIVLRYNSGGEQLILEAISDLKKQTLGSPVSTVSTVSTPANADAEVETSETRGDPSSASDQGFQDGQMQEAAPSAHDMEEGQTHISMGSKEESNTESGERHRDNVEDLPPQKRTSYAVPSADFVTMPLEPLELRFAIIKRLSQLTGYRIPDPLTTPPKTLRPIYSYLRRDRDSKSKKLADHLLTKRDVVSLPNVHIMPRRETPVDKDRRLGRWKIIEAELQSKGLPVLSRSRL